MVNDIARAFFEAKATRQICVSLPGEVLEPGEHKKDLVGYLEMSLYGTRDAAMNWPEEVAKQMKLWGFVRGVYNPCLYYNPLTGLQTMVHGDGVS